MPKFQTEELLSREEKRFAQGHAADPWWRWEQNADFCTSGLDIVPHLIKITLYVKERDILPQWDLRQFRSRQDWLSTFQNQGSFPLKRDNWTIHNKSLIWQISFLLLPSRSQPSQIYLLSEMIWQTFLPYFFIIIIFIKSVEMLWFFFPGVLTGSLFAIDQRNFITLIQASWLGKKARTSHWKYLDL